jgi:hypothetical protein
VDLLPTANVHAGRSGHYQVAVPLKNPDPLFDQRDFDLV